MVLSKRDMNVSSMGSPVPKKRRKKEKKGEAPLTPRPAPYQPTDLSPFEKISLCTPVVSVICKFLTAKEFATLQRVARSWLGVIQKQRLRTINLQLTQQAKITKTLRWLAKYHPRVGILQGFTAFPGSLTPFRDLTEVSICFSAEQKNCLESLTTVFENNGPSMRVLRLSGGISDGEEWEPVWLSLPRNLDTLDLSQLEFTKTDLSIPTDWLNCPIPTLPMLKTLVFPEFRDGVPRNLHRLIEKASVLERVTLPVIKKSDYDMRTLTSLIQREKTLRHLIVHPCTEESSCTRENENQLVELLGYLPELQTFVKDCTSEEGVDSLIDALAGRPKLKTLELEAFGLTRSGFFSATRNFFNLKSLTLLKVNSNIDLSSLDVIPGLDRLEIVAVDSQCINLNLPIKELIVQSFFFSRLHLKPKRIGFECGSYVRKELRHLTLKGERTSFDSLKSGLLLKSNCSELETMTLQSWGESNESPSTIRLIAQLFAKLPKFQKVFLHTRGNIQIFTKDAASYTVQCIPRSTLN